MNALDKALGQFENEKWSDLVLTIMHYPALKRNKELLTAMRDKKRSLVNTFGRKATRDRRVRFRDFAIAYANVTGDTVFEYPDGTPLTTPVSEADEEETRYFEQHELNNQVSAVVICFEGQNAKIQAQIIVNQLEHLLESQNNLAWLLHDKDLALKFVRVHDCQQHPLR